MSSSISSSEESLPKKGFPAALLIALVIVLLVEVGLHAIPRIRLFGYDPGLPFYYEVRHHLDAFGAADISILGSSRGREAIVAPELKALCEKQLKRPVTISNYSCADADANVVELILQLVLESKRKPELILYLVSPRCLLGDIQKEGTLRILKAGRSEFSLSSWMDYFLESHYLTYRHRFRPRHVLAGLLQGKTYPDPLKGELTEWEAFTPHKHLIGTRVTDQSVKQYIQQLLDDRGRYVLGDVRIAAMKSILQSCKAANVPIILVEVPTSAIFQKHLPSEVYPKFYQILDRISAVEGVPFFKIQDLGLRLAESDFREQSHLNYDGGLKLTEAIGSRVILPAFRVEEEPAKILPYGDRRPPWRASAKTP